MAFNLERDLQRVPPGDFTELDPGAAVTESYARLTGVGSAMWTEAYLVGSDRGRLVSATPLYSSRARAWPPYLGLEGRHVDPGNSVLVGTRAGYRSSLRVNPAAVDPIPYGEALRANEFTSGKSLVFPFCSPHDAAWLDVALPGRICWAVASHFGHYDLVEGSQESRKVRKYLRRDCSLVEMHGVTTSIQAWHEVKPWASDLIAAHNSAKGARESAPLVAWRYEEWSRVAGVTVVAVVGESARGRAVAVGLIHDGVLTMMDVGVSVDDADDRLALYVGVTSAGPRAVATQYGLGRIDVGAGATDFKRRRGAVITELRTGVAAPATG